MANDAYYNENDPKAAAWLRELIKEGLIPDGEVDERDIREIPPNDLRGFKQHHFFAGIGGWPYALQLAGWPDDQPVCTGSCPCQPFSSAGKRKGTKDERHLWPAFRWLIAQLRPPVCFGEQVESADGFRWLAGIRDDLEAIGYRVGAADLCAAGLGAPHIRQRLFWVANAPVDGRQGLQRSLAAQVPKNRTPQALDAWHGTGNPFEHWKELLAGACVRRMDDGLSSGLVVRPALRGFGNAIVPQVAAEFIGAFLDVALSRGTDGESA